MNYYFIATVLAAFSAAAAVEGEETRRLGSKAGKAKAGKGGSYSCSVSTKSGKGSKGSSKGGKGSSFSYYLYSMSYPSSCEELDSMFQPVYMVSINSSFRVEKLDESFLSNGCVSEECARWIACNNGNSKVPSKTLEQLLADCYYAPLPEENLASTNPVYISDGLPCQECGPKPTGYCEIYNSENPVPGGDCY